jgi:hypothetical protein
MPRGLRLQRFSIRNANHWHLRVFRLRVEVAEVSSDMTEYVFVYRRNPPDPNSGEVFDEFCAVASITDLSEYPIGDPDPNNAFPFFRKNFVEVDVRSSQEFAEAWELLKTHVCELVEALDRADDLVLDEEFTCGELDTGSASLSGSASISGLALFTLSLSQLANMTLDQLHTMTLS